MKYVFTVHRIHIFTSGELVPWSYSFVKIFDNWEKSQALVKIKSRSNAWSQIYIKNFTFTHQLNSSLPIISSENFTKSCSLIAVPRIELKTLTDSI